MSRATTLGKRREVLLRQGPIRYCERGEGEPIVFIHPMVVNGDLWRKVVPELADDHRCIAPDWPLGGHDVPMAPAADLSPPGIAEIIADFIEALDLRGVTLVGNDTGGALAQLVITRRPERIGRVVLVTCDAFDNFPPFAAKPLVWLAQVPGLPAIGGRMIARSRLLQRSPAGFGMLVKRGFEREQGYRYIAPSLANPAVLRDARKALRGLAPEHTEEAARRLHEFDGPALVAWNPEDRFFPFEHAERLAQILPDARLEVIEDSYTFVPEDQPERLAGAIRSFMADTEPRGSALEPAA
jgi:pimeloyl-ACP methyl ester carboxylesterase